MKLTQLNRKFGTLRGFTIVELLIVIVVIAILAVVVAVSYNGIVTGANDAAIKSDIESIGRELMQRQARTGNYPVFTDTTAGPGFNFKVNQEAYHTSGFNLYICQSDTDPQSGFAIIARSKSGSIFAWQNGGSIPYTGGWSTSSTLCPALGYTSYNFTYGRTDTNTWNAWTAG